MNRALSVSGEGIAASSEEGMTTPELMDVLRRMEKSGHSFQSMTDLLQGIKESAEVSELMEYLMLHQLQRKK